MRVLIAGCGYVGSALAKVLVQRGDLVWGLRRGGGALPDGVQSVVADLTGPLPPLPDVDALVFAAAAPASDDASYRATYVDGLANLLAASPAGRVVFCSSTAVYGQADGSWVDEEASTAPAGFSGTRMVEAERVLFATGRPAVAVRFGGIYGPERTRLVDSVRDGTAARHQGPPEYTNRIHRDDCAAVLAHLLAGAQALRIYNAVDERPAPRNEVLEWLAAELGVPPPPFGERSPRARGESNKRVANTRLLASGYRFLFPSYRDGYRALMASTRPT
jgi:nucleoside-diphosphate-sugar epimerase